jgi:hypothetical protein
LQIAGHLPPSQAAVQLPVLAHIPQSPVGQLGMHAVPSSQLAELLPPTPALPPLEEPALPPNDDPPLDDPPLDDPPADDPPLDAPPLDAPPLDEPPLDAPPLDVPALPPVLPSSLFTMHAPSWDATAIAQARLKNVTFELFIFTPFGAAEEQRMCLANLPRKTAFLTSHAVGSNPLTGRLQPTDPSGFRPDEIRSLLQSQSTKTASAREKRHGR